MAGILGGLFDGLFGGEDIYGRKPDVPDFPTFEEALRRSLDANWGNFEEFREMANRTSNADLDTMLGMIGKILPNYQAMLKGSTKLTSQMLKGRVPKDVSDLVQRNAAERSLAGGYGGSGMARNLEARDLGLTSLDITQRGLNSAARWLSYGSTIAGQNQMSTSAMFVRPADFYANSVDDWNAKWMQEKINAAPDPVKRGQMDTSMELIGMVLSAYGGGAGYKSTYSPDYGGGIGSGSGGGGGGMGGAGRGWQASYDPSQSEYSRSGGGGNDLTKGIGFF